MLRHKSMDCLSCSPNAVHCHHNPRSTLRNKFEHSYSINRNPSFYASFKSTLHVGVDAAVSWVALCLYVRKTAFNCVILSMATY